MFKLQQLIQILILTSRIRMGQTAETPFKDQLKNSTVLSTDDENNITYFKDSVTNEKTMMRKHILTELNYYEDLLKSHESRKSINSENILKLKNLEGKIDETPCTTYYYVYTIWEHETNNLANLLKQKATNNQMLKESQIWSIATDCIKGLAEMEKNNIIHDKITKEAIAIGENSNRLVFKMRDPLSIPESDNYLLISTNRKTSGIYLSPDQCNALQMMSFCKKSTKDDVWAFGMILLEAALMKNQEQCYDEDSRKINSAKITENINRAGRLYGEQIMNFLSKMLQFNKKLRPSWSQLLKIVSDRECPRKIAEIANLQTNCDIRESPQVLPYKSKAFDHNETFSFAKNNNYTNPQGFIQKQNVFVQHQIINPKPQTYQFRQPLNFAIPVNQPIIYAPIVRKSKPSNFIQYQTPVNVNFNYPIHVNNQNMVRNKVFEVKKFTSPASCEGLLFNMAPATKQIKQVMQIQSYCEKPKISETRHQPQISNQPRQRPKNFNNQIKNAQSITYEGDFRPIFLNNAEKQRQQQKTQKEEMDPIQMQISYSENQMENVQYVIETFSVGSRYQGYKLKNMRHGQGKFFYQDGGMYEGQWKYNKMNGKGMLYYQSGILAYDGQWQEDQFQGKGKLFNEYPQKYEGAFNYQNFDEIGQCWQYYEGQFKNDLKQGRGKLMLTNGQYYVGNFSQDMIEGNGKFFTKKGVVKGAWEGNQLVRTD